MESTKPEYISWCNIDGLYYPMSKENVVLTLSHGFVRVEDFCDGIANVSDGKKWGCINCQGILIVPIEYDMINVIEYQYDDSNYCLMCGRDGKKISGRYKHDFRRKDDIYTGVYDLYDSNGNLLIGGFDECKFLLDYACFLFGRTWSIEKKYALNKEWYEFDYTDNGKWLLLDKYFSLPYDCNSADQFFRPYNHIYDWNYVPRKKIAGEIFTDCDSFIGTKNSRPEKKALFIDLPEEVLFDSILEEKGCLVCRNDKGYCVIITDKEGKHRKTKYYEKVRPFDSEYTCVLEKNRIGLLKDGYLVLECNYSYITKPVNNWVFAIKEYPFYPDSKSHHCCFVMLLNVEQTRVIHDWHLYDEIIAIKTLDNNTNDIDDMFYRGVFSLYPVDDVGKGTQSVSIKKDYLPLFTKEFRDSIGDCDKINEELGKNRNEWISSDDMFYMNTYSVYIPEYNDNSILDALDGDPGAYWNID